MSWLNNENGLRFGDYGSILSAGGFTARTSQGDPSCSIEIWLEPGLTADSNTFLAFYSAGVPSVAFSLHQSISDLNLRREILNGENRAGTVGFMVDDVFRQKKPVFVTVTSGAQGTSVYINGALTKTSSSFGLSGKDFSGRLVVANSPIANDSWSGRLLGLAIYERGLTAAQVLRHYKEWTTGGKPAAAETENAVALYLFNERSGSIVRNQINPATDLLIPEHYFVLHAPFLSSLSDDYYPGWHYWKYVAINIAGFIPLGFVFCAYFWEMKRRVWASILLGFTVSLSIEVLQAFLPTRDSGMTDIITNTFGTALGAMLCSCNTVQGLFTRAGLRADRLEVRFHPLEKGECVCAETPSSAVEGLGKVS
ncbi:MAG: VanZ family protein [Candidatus Sulfotelmatobacter sp.]